MRQRPHRLVAFERGDRPAQADGLPATTPTQLRYRQGAAHRLQREARTEPVDQLWGRIRQAGFCSSACECSNGATRRSAAFSARQRPRPWAASWRYWLLMSAALPAGLVGAELGHQALIAAGSAVAVDHQRAAGGAGSRDHFAEAAPRGRCIGRAVARSRYGSWPSCRSPAVAGRTASRRVGIGGLVGARRAAVKRR